MISQVQDLRRKGKFEQANTLCLQLIKDYPEQAMFYFEYACGLDTLAMETEAMPYYEQSIKLGLPREELERAYIALGTIYRTHGRYEDARDLFDEAMDTFANEPQIRLYYAMSLYHVQEYAKAIELIMQIAATETQHEGILKHRWPLQFLSSRLDIPAEKVIQLDIDDAYKPSTTSIVEKVRKSLQYFEVLGFHSGKSAAYDDYYLYFDHSDKEIRSCAVAQLTVLLGIWHTQSAHPFIPQHERKFLGRYNPHHPSYELHNYIEAFYQHHERIKAEFPVMHEYIVDFFIRIERDRGLPYEKMFPELEPALVQKLREDVLIPYVPKQHTPIKYFLKEAGITTSFKSNEE